MCGIAGTFGPVSPDDGRVQSTLEGMKNRGPDANGVYRGAIGENAVTLLHTRLAVIDLDPSANQPMERGDLVLVFNGEIYNYLEIRKELKGKGLSFKTNSDSEVLLAAYEAWGEGCFDRLEGMWAFALMDRKKGTLLLSRDRFGEKPLFYMVHEKTLYFASSPQALASLSGRELKPNHAHLRRYLVNGFRSIFKTADTFFQGVSELPPATHMKLAVPERHELTRYWRLSFRPAPMSAQDALEGVRERLFRAMEIRLRADVPVAFCLSGGVDSTALAGIAARHLGQDIHAFSVIDSDERYNESNNINSMVKALGCDHHVAHTSPEGFFERMADLAANFNAPVPTISYYVHSFLSEEIRKQGYTVAISGTGADEIFTGYYDHYSFWLAGMHGRDDFDALVRDWRESYGSWVNNPHLQDPLAFVENPDARNHIYQNRDLFNSFMVEATNDDFAEENYANELLRNRMMNELNHEVVPVILRADDSNSMRWSVENRSPYLDRELAEFLFTVPSEHLIHDGYPKWLLRSAVEGLVPDDVRLDKRKRGFNASIDSLVDRKDPQTRARLLDESPIFDIVKRESIESFLDADMTDNSFSKFMFSFVSAKMFLESNLLNSQEEIRKSA